MSQQFCLDSNGRPHTERSFIGGHDLRRSEHNRSDRRAKFFWMLMGLGFATWLCSQMLWTYFEVVLRQETPNPFVGDVILFLHIVPMMAALAVQPHMRQERHITRLGSLDVVLLLIGWLYLYLFLVIPGSMLP